MADETGALNGDPRRYLEARVAERARHTSAEDVQITCSFASAERILGREYHGRFLIELLQNAADAWRLAKTGERSQVSIILDSGPVLVVANRGLPFPAKVVIESLGHIGRAMKAEGEAIGHKGIGFKSVLELTLTPEIYSGLQTGSCPLAVRFDPVAALDEIRAASGAAWGSHLGQLGQLADELAAVPVLRYPKWVENTPAIVAELASKGFDTVVILPFTDLSEHRLELDVNEWLATVRESFRDVTDQILMLLGTFAEVRIEDRLASRVEIVTPDWHASEPISAMVTREIVEVHRSGADSSRWRLYRSSLPDVENLAAEVAVGIRLGAGQDRPSVLPAVGAQASSPFHLFFPTVIGSGLPLLLHGYFEVNAARTGFYHGSASRNEAILEALSELAATAVADTAACAAADLASLVDLVADAPEPEDPYARRFREDTLSRLDAVEWVPLGRGESGSSYGRPPEVLADRNADLARRVGEVFPAGYVRARCGLRVPAPCLTDEGLAFLAGRRPIDSPDLWGIVECLLQPGDAGLWPPGQEDQGFRALLELLAALRASDRDRSGTLLAALRGNPAARLLPVVSASGGRRLLPVPDPKEGVAGSRSTLVMARVRAGAGGDLVPPAALDVAFLPDGLLQTEAEVDRAKPLGVRPFTVDDVLDRLGTSGGALSEASDVIGFVWALLFRARQSELGTANGARKLSSFAPTDWFWCRPGRGAGSDGDALRQRRERSLAGINLPARDGTWRPAGTLAFGSDWAAWLESGGCGPVTAAVTARIAAYRALNAVSPGDQAMLASPTSVLALLPDVAGAIDAAGDVDEEPSEVGARDRERFAFLLRLGVWEVVPVEGYDNRATSARDGFPWTTTLQSQRLARVEASGGWKFDMQRWGGTRHHNVFAAEDFRFQWALDEAASRDALNLTRALAGGAVLYAGLLNLAVFCMRCNDNGTGHINPYRSGIEDDYPTLLALQLGDTAWVPATLDGRDGFTPMHPTAVWWDARPPSGPGLQQSPLRFVNLCHRDADLPDLLRRIATIQELASADLDALRLLLAGLRQDFESEELTADPATSTSARQAFIGLHRRAYERLAALATGDPEHVADTVGAVGILCELGDRLEYRPASEVFHHDGTYAAYRRHFVGSLPFVVIAPDRGPVAKGLGVKTFEVEVTRRDTGADRWTDVTEDLHDAIGDRAPELLAIVVNHRLGTQNLDATSGEFEERSQRLKRLKVRQIPNLVLDARAVGTDYRVVLGEGSDQDVFLEGPSSVAPVLWHDFNGDAWEDRVRRKLAPHLATLLQNPAYTATFTVFLMAETDTERAAVLQDLGISTNEVDAIKTRIGAVTADDVRRHLRWFQAVLDCLGSPVHLATTNEASDALVAAGLTQDIAQRIAELGGGEDVRRDLAADGALHLLATQVDLAELDRRLQVAGDLGLVIRVASNALDRWRSAHGRHVAAVLAHGGVAPADAKATPGTWAPPPELASALEVDLIDVLAPVVNSLRRAGLEPDEVRLADAPTDELVRVANVDGVAELDALVELLYDPEEQARVLRSFAAAWRSELFILGVLARCGPREGRATIKAHAEAVDTILAPNPPYPSVLRLDLGSLFSQHPALAVALEARLNDNIAGHPPDPDEIIDLAARNGLPAEQLDAVRHALKGPRRDLARQLRERIAKLTERQVKVIPPTGLRAATSKPPGEPGARTTIRTVQIGEAVDKRKRQLGDEGERWALAAVVDQILTLDGRDRARAVAAIAEFANIFNGPPVDRAHAHAQAVLDFDLDPDELVDELSGFLHVATHSAAFGFDLFAWLPPRPGAHPIPMCVDVKSSVDGSFFLSVGEWSRAQWFAHDDHGDRYAVLVVRRARSGGPPLRLDLLVDPVALVNSGQLTRKEDTYKVSYESGPTREVVLDTLRLPA